MQALDLIREIAGHTVYHPSYEPKVRVLTYNELGEAVVMMAAPIIRVSGTGDIIIKATDLIEEKV